MATPLSNTATAFFLIHSYGQREETRHGERHHQCGCRYGSAQKLSGGRQRPPIFAGHLPQGSAAKPIYAAIYGKISGREVSEYQQIGIYKLLLPYNESELSEEYYDTFISPLMAYDEANGSELLQTALVFEEKSGNVREMSQQLSTHENTMRYRLKKISELVGKDAIDDDFGEQLSLAVKLYRIQLADVAPLPG